MATRLVPGAVVEYAGSRYRVRRPLGPDAVLLASDAGAVVSASPLHVTAVVDPAAQGARAAEPRLLDAERHTPSEWAEAERRREAVARVLRVRAGREAAVADAARELGLRPRRMRALLARAEAAGRADAAMFLPARRGPRPPRLPEAVEAIVEGQVRSRYASKARPTVARLAEGVRGACLAAGLPPPAYNTVKARVAARDPAWLARRRGEPAKARSMRLLTGAHPGASAPWERVQIDATRCDLLLVRDRDRAVVGRATLTVALDLYSRAICGFSVLLEGAGGVSVATCLAHACLPKDGWLRRLGHGDLHWPVWGRPLVLEYDRGPENAARGVQRGLAIHGIRTKVRPKGRPELHGHVERLIGTVMRRVHDLPGTTFSGVGARGEAEPGRLACISLPELEEILAVEAVRHNETRHGATGERPIERYLGHYRRPGLADAERIPEPPEGGEGLLLDFLPFERRTLRRTGVRLFGVDYASRDLEPLWSEDRRRGAAAPRRIVVYDPRGLAVVHVADEATGAYVPAHYRVPRADMTLAESEEARRALAGLRAEDRTEARLFEHVERIRAVVERGRTATERAKAERSAQARRGAAGARGAAARIPPAGTEAPAQAPGAADAPLRAPVEPFDDVAEL